MTTMYQATYAPSGTAGISATKTTLNYTVNPITASVYNVMVGSLTVPLSTLEETYVIEVAEYATASYVSSSYSFVTVPANSSTVPYGLAFVPDATTDNIKIMIYAVTVS